MNDKEYRQHPALAQSDLRMLIEESPLHFHHKKYGNAEQESTPAMILGSAIHTIALERNLFDARYLKAVDADKRSKAGKELHEAQAIEAEASGKIILSAADYELCLEMEKELDNPAFNFFKQGSEFEQEIFFSFHSIDCKAKLDIINVDQGFICDFKTTADAGNKFVRDIYSLGYHRQAAWYCEAAKQKYGREFSYYLFAVEKKPPYASAVYEIPFEGLEIGLNDMLEAISKYKYCLDANEFATYNNGQVVQAFPPAWLNK